MAQIEIKWKVGGVSLETVLAYITENPPDDFAIWYRDEKTGLVSILFDGEGYSRQQADQSAHATASPIRYPVEVASWSCPGDPSQSPESPPSEKPSPSVTTADQASVCEPSQFDAGVLHERERIMAILRSAGKDTGVGLAFSIMADAIDKAPISMAVERQVGVWCPGLQKTVNDCAFRCVGSECKRMERND